MAKKVFVVKYNPYVDVGKTVRLYDYMRWNNPDDITEGTIDFFYNASGGRVQYQVADVAELDEFPVKADGFTYTVDHYLAVMQNSSLAHHPDGVNYNAIVNDPRLDICGKANRGEIDEVWIYNGPYFGFWESTLVGPGAYWYNSPPVNWPHNCDRMIPIMGPNPERYVSEAVENFGHRTESTMMMVYNYEWEQNHTRNNWEKFTLVDSLSPNYNYSGCGNIHFPPNGTADYDWSNPGTAQTYCEDFHNYPNLNNPTSVLQTVTASTWGCTPEDCQGARYFAWWFGNLPANSGCGTDGVASDWWTYFANPTLALSPRNASAQCWPNRLMVPFIRR